MIRRFTVTGKSMEPSYHDGDVVIAHRFARYKENDVIVCHDPRERDRLLIKRVHSVALSSYTVVGDNPDASTDSRSFGAVQKKDIIGRVILS